MQESGDSSGRPGQGGQSGQESFGSVPSPSGGSDSFGTIPSHGAETSAPRRIRRPRPRRRAPGGGRNVGLLVGGVVAVLVVIAADHRLRRQVARPVRSRLNRGRNARVRSEPRIPGPGVARLRPGRTGEPRLRPEWLGELRRDPAGPGGRPGRPDRGTRAARPAGAGRPARGAGPDHLVGVAGTCRRPRPRRQRSRRRRRAVAGRWILTGLIVIVVALIALVVLARLLNRSNPLAVGDCIDQTKFTTSVSDVKGKKTVDCTDAAASHKVIGVVTNKPSSELNDENVCKAYPQTVATIWLNDQGSPGTIYCLAELSK